MLTQKDQFLCMENKYFKVFRIFLIFKSHHLGSLLFSAYKDKCEYLMLKKSLFPT